jgi:peptidoglycan/LPS O-acetylase OafA/YrhL
MAWFERLLIPVGLCSYSVYLLHEPCIAPALRAVHGWLETAPPFAVWVAAPTVIFAPILTVSWLYYRWVEIGSVEAGHRLFAARPRSAMSTSSDEKN